MTRIGWAMAFAWALGASAPASAASLVGELDPNNAQDVVLYPFTLSSAGSVTIQSWGYGGSAGAPGGTNAAGAVIAGGGFDPYVSLFSGTGPTATFVASNDDGLCPPGTIADALCGDSTLVTAVLPAGSYTLAVSAFLNMSLAENLGSGTLGDGFVGLGSFGTRSAAYAVDISGTTLVAPTKVVAQSPNGLTFGPQTVGTTSGPLAVTVTNTGSASILVGALAVGGTNASNFAASTTCAGSLAPAASCVVSVTFTPDAVGPFSATVTLASDASNAPTVIAVGGTGTLAAVSTASLSATSLAFGAIVYGQSATLPLTITNTGGAVLDIASIALGGAQPGDYSLVDGCSGQAIAPLAACIVQVRFTPATFGPRTASLTIVSDASNSPVVVVATGVGVPQPPAAPVPANAPAALALAALALAALGMRRLRKRMSLRAIHRIDP